MIQGKKGVCGYVQSTKMKYKDSLALMIFGEISILLPKKGRGAVDC